MHLLTTTQPFGRVAHTRVHPAFVALHGRLSGDEAGVRELAESGVGLGTLLSLYPLELSAYLPHLSATFMVHTSFKADPIVHRFWQIDAVNEAIFKTAVYLMLDDRAVKSVVQVEIIEDGEVVLFIERLTDSLRKITKRTHGGNQWAKLIFSHFDVRARVQELLELMLLLCYWNDEGYANMDEGARVKLDAEIERVLKHFGCKR